MCINSYNIKYKGAKLALQGASIPIPCGKCPQCKNRRISDWLFRLTIHQKKHPNPLFVTLTYATQNLTYGNNGRTPTLYKRDLQLFFKRLRKLETKLYGTSNLSYYACGEYGTKYHRPHYHILLYNLSSPQLISQAWGLGYTKILPLYSGAIQYVLKYMSKPTSKYTLIQNEFALMSKNIGANYITKNIIQYHNQSPAHSHVTLAGGKKMPLPKYYKEKIYDFSMRWQVAKYLEQQSELSEQSYIRRLKLENYNKSQDYLIKLAQIRKYNIKFDKRIQETF